MKFAAFIILLIIFFIIILFYYKKNKELKFETAYLKELFENSQDGILILDNNDRIVKANRSFQRILQYKSDEIKGLYVNDIIATPETKDAFEISDVIIHGGTANSETRRKRKDGKLIDVRVDAFPLMLDSNQIGLCAIYKDIAYKKESEKALELQRIYFTKLFENSPEAICIIDTEDRFIDVNTAFEKLFGYRKEELVNYYINDKIVQAESIEEATNISDDVIKGNVVEYETLRKRKDGSLVDVCILGYPIIFENSQIGVFGIYKDITERKRSDEVVKASEYTFRRLFEGSSDAIFIMEDNKIVDCNEAAIKMLGYDSKSNVIDKSPWELSPEKQPDGKFSKDKALKLIAKTQINGKSKFEWWHQRRDNTLIPVEIMLTSILLNGKKVVHALCRDVDERKQLEQKLEYLSYHDQLTDLYNRRFFEEELMRLDVDRNYPLTIVMADVNGLKLVNDSLGHAIGDELLRKVAEVLKKGCRAGEIIARLGGDEFVILLPKTDTYQAELIIQRIKTIALKEKLGSIDISISIGLASKNKREEQIQEIFKKAENHMYKKKIFEGPNMREKTINAIIRTLHEKNKREKQHSYRVSALCQSIGQAIGLSDDEIQELKTVGLLHDIGKIAIEENILNKSGKLIEVEIEEIKRHPEIGYRILSTVSDMSEIAEFVLAHHERWDGNGYPKGLKKDQIPLQSRIISIADAYDAMTNEGSYRSAMPKEIAIQELQKNAGAQFDPDMVNVFIEKVLINS